VIGSLRHIASGRGVVACVVAVGALALTACDPNRFVSGWVPYWSGTEGRAGYGNTDASMLFSEISPFWFTATGPTGAVALTGTESGLSAAISTARSRGLPVIPTITDGTGRGVMAGIVADPAKRAAHINGLVDTVMRRGLDGIDLDYEGFAFTDDKATWPTTAPNWVTFVRELGDALHGRGKLLTATIPATWMDGSTRRGYWVYEQQAIAPFVDRVRLMVYDWTPSTPSPTAPMFWVEQVLAYSTPRVPVEKLQLGVPAYGRHWRTKANAGETCPDGALGRVSVTTRRGPELAAAQKLTPQRHSSGELTFTWTQVATGQAGTTTPPTWTPPPVVAGQVDDPATGGGLQPAKRLVRGGTVTCTVRHTVFYPDALSIAQRAQAALARDWSGIIVWALGYEDPAVYQALSTIGRQRPNGATGVALDEPVGVAGGIRLRGWALDPETDLPIAVRLTVGSASRTVTARTSRPDIAAVLPGVGAFHGYDEAFTLPPGTYQACATALGWVGQPDGPQTCRTVTVI